MSKKNSYVIKSNKARLPVGVAGYKGAYILTDEKKAEKLTKEEFEKKYPFSPFLTHPIDMNQKEKPKEAEREKDSSTFMG